MSDFDAQAFLANLTERPGVYRMYAAGGELLYVGKARNLKKRVASYFRPSGQGPKTQALVAQIADIQIMVTRTEGEALLLECNLIKEHLPRYNILLRDDKSFPYIHVSTDHQYPRVNFHRGAKNASGRYFGPYPNSWAVKQTLNLIQRVFAVRSCDDSYFAHRTRPCLQHQIHRCSAPCVELISPESYAQDVRNTMLLLEGKNGSVIDDLAQRMQDASQAMAYELAGKYRDQIRQLRLIQEKQYVANVDGEEVDVIAVAMANGVACCTVFFIRGGTNLGNSSYFPRVGGDDDMPNLLTAFMMQYYSQRPLPANIVVGVEPADSEALLEALKARADRETRLHVAPRGDKAHWLQIAETNAMHALATRTVSADLLRQRFEALAEALMLDGSPARIDCFDVSHTGGELAVASCVVFDASGPMKSNYRRYNIENITPGDDYAAMEQAVYRHFRGIIENDRECPDLLLIDGGRGQVARAVEALKQLNVSDVKVVGVAKGADRKPGLEHILFADGQEKVLASDASALHLIQQIRDEAHRFAITGHRKRRSKARRESVLEAIEGLGAKRRQLLLKQFGGLQGIARAGVEDLITVKGISQSLARRIYDHFHGNEGT